MLMRPKSRVVLQTKSGEEILECSPNEKLLYAGLAQGLQLPYECATGTCGTCKARVMSGDVNVAWTEAPGAARLKRERGDILLCQASVGSDCMVRVAANVEKTEGLPLPKRYSGRLNALKMLTPDVMHLDVDLDAAVGFRAGQFMVLEVSSVQGGRAYSMVNYDDTTNCISFVIKRKPGGHFGNWLFESATAGDEVSLFGPLGRATWQPQDDQDILAIAGGSGIAGIMSILEHATRVSHFKRRRGDVFFGVRTLADAFYVEELSDYVARANGNLDVTLALSHEDVSNRNGHNGLRLAHGFVHEVAARAMAGRYDQVLAFLAGPAPMVDGAIRSLLTEARLTPNRIRFDKFS